MILNPGLTREKPGFGFEGVNPGLGYPGSGFALSSVGGMIRNKNKCQLRNPYSKLCQSKFTLNHFVPNSKAFYIPTFVKVICFGLNDKWKI